jgi:hypothetical protein
MGGTKIQKRTSATGGDTAGRGGSGCRDGDAVGVGFTELLCGVRSPSEPSADVEATSSGSTTDGCRVDVNRSICSCLIAAVALKAFYNSVISFLFYCKQLNP